MRRIATEKLEVARIPGDGAPLDELIRFAHSHIGYAEKGSFDACAAVANKPDHSTIEHLRSCLFFEARRWRHCGEDPDGEEMTYWRWLVAEIRHRLCAIESLTASQLSDLIDRLSADDSVPVGTPGYNRYASQKAHWLGWLRFSRDGTFLRNPGQPDLARTVYNRIGEPKMLSYLVNAAGVDALTVQAAVEASDKAHSRASACAAFRLVCPWRGAGEALLSHQFRQRQFDRVTSSIHAPFP